MVRAAMLLSAPANPLSRTAMAMSAREGATFGLRHARLLTTDLHSLAHFLQEGGGSIVNDARHIAKEKLKESNQTEKERKMSKSKRKM
jgi:hypothetical protein